MRQTLTNKYVQGLKKRARALRDERGITLGKALDEMAREAGYAGWRELMATHENAKAGSGSPSDAGKRGRVPPTATSLAVHDPSFYSANDGILPPGDPTRLRYDALLAKMGGDILAGQDALTTSEKEEFASIANLLWKLDPVAGTPAGRGIFRSIGVVGGRFTYGHAFHDPLLGEGRSFQVNGAPAPRLDYNQAPAKWVHGAVLLGPDGTRIIPFLGEEDAAQKEGGSKRLLYYAVQVEGSVSPRVVFAGPALDAARAVLESWGYEPGKFVGHGKEIGLLAAVPVMRQRGGLTELEHMINVLRSEGYVLRCYPWQLTPENIAARKRLNVETDDIPGRRKAAGGPGAAWQEYDLVAEAVARKTNGKWKYGAPLPVGTSGECLRLVEDDPEAFEERVRATAYALAMDGVLPEE